MYARVSTYEGGTSEDYDRGLETMKSELVPKVREMQGYKGLLSLVDRSTGQSLIIALYDSEASMSSAREAAEGLRKEAATTSGASVASVVEYEVGIAEFT